MSKFFWDLLSKVRNLDWLGGGLIMSAITTTIAAIVSYFERIPWTFKIPAILGTLFFSVGFSFLIWLWFNWKRISKNLLGDNPSKGQVGFFAEVFDPEFQRKLIEGRTISLAREYYSNGDRDRIADTLSVLSNSVNKEAAIIRSSVSKAMLGARSENKEIMKESINELGECLLRIAKVILNEGTGILSTNQAYAPEIEGAFHKNEFQNAIGRINDDLHKLTSAHVMFNRLDPSVSSSDRQNFRYALQVFFDNSNKSLADFGKWRKEFETRRNQTLAALAAEANIVTNPPA